jgi:hypothetical protein
LWCPNCRDAPAARLYVRCSFTHNLDQKIKGSVL